MTETLPSHASVVVIGGGVVGASTAYHLAGLGLRDTVLLERAKISSGTSWHAAGNMETWRADPLIGEMIGYGVALYPKLEAETGQILGWRQPGRVMFATSPERMAQFRTLPAQGKARGIEVELLSPREVAQKLPIIRQEGLLGGVFVPSDGRIDPTGLATAFARGAKQRGARIVEDAPVTDIRVKNGRVEAVVTPQGEIRCESVVIAAGLWSRRLGAMVGVRVPLHAVHHFYMLTKPIEGVPRDLPLFLSYDEKVYGREDVGGLLAGCFDENAIPVDEGELPRDFSFGLLDENWGQVEREFAVITHRFPVLETAEVRMLLGEAPGVRGVFMAAGMNSSGIALSAGAGKLTAEWIVEGRPSLDASRLDIKRFARCETGVRFLRARVSEVPTAMCKLWGPGEGFASGRGLRRSPLHDVLAERGAVFGQVAGWERPLWVGPSREGEWEALRRSAVILDRSSDCVLALCGTGAEAAVGRLTGVPGKLAIGAAVVAPLLNERGGVEALPVLWRESATSFLFVAEPDQATLLGDWLGKQIEGAGDVSLLDVTESIATIALAGPRAAHIVAALAGDDTIPGMRPGDSRAVEIGPVLATVIRWPAGGDWHLVMAASSAGVVEAEVTGVAEREGARWAGALLADELRVRRLIPAFGREAVPVVSAVASGVDRGLDVTRDFTGRDAVLRDRAAAPSRVIRAFSISAGSQGPFVNAPVLSGETMVGHVTSGAPSGDADIAVVMALVERAAVGFDVLIGGDRVKLVGYIVQPEMD